MVKNYVRYVDEMENPFIQNLYRFDSKFNVLKVTENEEIEIKPLFENGNVPSRFKYVKSVDDLNTYLDKDETLIVEIKADEVEYINSENLFSHRFPEKSPKYGIGQKAYLVDYNFSFNGLPKEVEKTSIPVVLLKEQNSDLYLMRQVHTIMDSINERRNDLKRGFGGYSDLYYQLTDPQVAETFQDDAIEIVMTKPETWMVTKVPGYMKDEQTK